MQQKGVRFTMTRRECCRYIRTYSELEGLQHAHTLIYYAATTPQGVVMELRREQDGRVHSSAVLTPPGSFARVMLLLRYLCENGIEQGQWLEVLDDVQQPYLRLETTTESEIPGQNPAFCGICRF